MVELLELAALVLASAFTGAAFYVNSAEHPARMTLPIGTALAQWKPSYKAGALMQASLAALGGTAGIAVVLLGGNLLWGVGGGLLIANWPYTLLVILPLNNTLMALAPEAADEQTRGQLTRWNALHAWRTVLGALAVIAMIAAATRS